MADLLRPYAGVEEQIDPDLKVVSVEIVERNGEERLEVLQRGEFESEKIEFRREGSSWLLSDDEPREAESSVMERTLWRAKPCGTSPASDHEAVAREMEEQVGRDTREGPDNGNLACVWAVRHIVHDALGRWITKSDYTPTVEAELRNCFGEARSEGDVLAGGIILSPTAVVRLPDGKKVKRIGHIGLLAAGSGGGRRIYSNRSSTARWAQGHTIQKWAEYYGGRGLQVMYYPLPLRGAAGIA